MTSSTTTQPGSFTPERALRHAGGPHRGKEERGRQERKSPGGEPGVLAQQDGDGERRGRPGGAGGRRRISAPKPSGKQVGESQAHGGLQKNAGTDAGMAGWKPALRGSHSSASSTCSTSMGDEITYRSEAQFPRSSMRQRSSRTGTRRRRASLPSCRWGTSYWRQRSHAARIRSEPLQAGHGARRRSGGDQPGCGFGGRCEAARPTTS